MSTLSKKEIETGFCVIDHNNVAIEIEYISFPKKNENGKTLYIKNSNKCIYLHENKCNKGRECEIYKKAVTEKYL